MKPVLFGLFFVLLLAPQAHAGAPEDANAGLAALNSGDYDKAIGLFSRAINYGLTGDDLEFAYASRGRAYLKKGDFSLAITDLDHARRAKPDDADAQADLVAAISAKLPAASIPGAPKPNFFRDLGKALVDEAAASVISGLQNNSQ